MLTKKEKFEIEASEIEHLSFDFFELQSRAKVLEEKLKKRKESFSNKFLRFFAKLDSNFYEFETVVGALRVTKVEVTKTSYDLNKLEQSLSKKQLNEIVDVKCEVVDVEGLFSYLREIGADAKMVKSFLVVNKSVNESKLEKALDLGYVESECVVDSLVLEKQNPYFKFTMKKK